MPHPIAPGTSLPDVEEVGAHGEVPPAEPVPLDARPPSTAAAAKAEVAVERPSQAAPPTAVEPDATLAVKPTSSFSAADVIDMVKPVSPSATPGGMPLEMRQALSALDEQLIAVLRSGYIRLVRTSWLLAQPDGFHMPYRQVLEALEASGVTPSPLLSPDEAVALIEKGDRSACILS